MKYRLRKISLQVWGVFIISILSFGSLYLGLKSYKSFYKNREEGLVEKKASEKTVKRSEKIDAFLLDTSSDYFFLEKDFGQVFTNIVIKDDNGYQSFLFDYVTGDKLNLEDIIKEGKREEFYEKVKELLYLKYPSFIADVLSENDKRNAYIFKDNAMVIYYYDYDISPKPVEELYLTINYNEIYTYLKFNVALDDTYQNEDGFAINKEKKLVSITFDDGPGAYTNELVDILAANKAHATFFMVGNRIAKLKDVVLNVYKNENEVAYHSYAHKSFKRQPLEEIQADFLLSNETLKSIIGVPFKLTRPPYGAINDEVKMGLDTSFILWNVDTLDWQHKDVDYLFTYTLSHINEGDIVLFHDIHRTSVDAIKAILPELYVRGYQVVTVSALANSYGISLENHNVYRHFSK